MNIKNIKLPEDFGYPVDLLGDIFAKQKELAKKYAVIEGHPGWPCKDINSKKTQAHIKDFAWRTTEEICEMRKAEEDSVDKEHGYEELGDALHFLTEMCIIFDYNPRRLRTESLKPMEAIFEEAKQFSYLDSCDQLIDFEVAKKLSVEAFIVELGWGMNFLKLKPWKQTGVPTDIPEFLNQVDKVWIYFAQVARLRGIKPQELYLLYVKKELVNRFRLRSNY